MYVGSHFTVIRPKITTVRFECPWYDDDFFDLITEILNFTGNQDLRRKSVKTRHWNYHTNVIFSRSFD